MLGFIQSQKPSVVYLTGGGALISPIVDALQKHLHQYNISLGSVDQDTVANGEQQWRLWNETGEGMHRLATAVGGASVILQASSVVVAGEGKPPQARAPMMTGPIDSFFPAHAMVVTKTAAGVAVGDSIQGSKVSLQKREMLNSTTNKSGTFIEAVKDSLAAACRYNSGDSLPQRPFCGRTRMASGNQS